MRGGCGGGSSCHLCSIFGPRARVRACARVRANKKSVLAIKLVCMSRLPAEGIRLLTPPTPVCAFRIQEFLGPRSSHGGRGQRPALDVTAAKMRYFTVKKRLYR